MRIARAAVIFVPGHDLERECLYIGLALTSMSLTRMSGGVTKSLCGRALADALSDVDLRLDGVRWLLRISVSRL